VIVYWAGWNTNWELFVAILIGFVLLAAHRRFGLAAYRLRLPSARTEELVKATA